MPSDSIPEIG